jgi:hypothetical protein
MEAYSIDVKFAIALVKAILDKFIGNATMSIEGDLSAVDLSTLDSLAGSETSSLKRQTIYPVLDFAVFPLTQENIIKFNKILTRIGIRDRVLHILVESDGQIVFQSHDQFWKDGTWISTIVGENFMEDLLQKNIIRGYKSF